MPSINLTIPDGSMEQKILGIFEDANLAIYFPDPRKNTGIINSNRINSPRRARPQEIPNYVRSGVSDFGITGLDCVRNAQAENDVIILQTYPISRASNQSSRIIIAVANDSPYTEPSQLPDGAIVYTEYVGLTKDFFASIQRPDIRIEFSFGKTEDKIIVAGAHAIVEITETGSSLRANNLREIHTIMETKTVLIANKIAYNNQDTRKVIDWLVSFIDAVIRGRRYFRVEINAPTSQREQAIEIFQKFCRESPTVLPEANPVWFDMIGDVLRERFEELIFQLQDQEIAVKSINAIEIRMLFESNEK